MTMMSLHLTPCMTSTSQILLMNADRTVTVGLSQSHCSVAKLKASILFITAFQLLEIRWRISKYRLDAEAKGSTVF